MRRRLFGSAAQLALVLLGALVGQAHGQWTDAARLSAPDHTGDNKEPRLTGRAAGGFHAVYRHFASNGVEVWVRSWQGGALRPGVKVHSLGFLAGGEICEAGDRSVHVVWENWDDANEQIWWARSTDGGLTFPAKQAVSAYGTSPNGQAKNPMVVPFGSATGPEAMVLSWGAPPQDRMHHNRFDGATFLGHTNSGISTSNSYAAWGGARSPVDGSLWRTFGRESGGLWQIYIRRFDGTSWTGEQAVSTHTGSGFASRPQVAINAAGEVMVVWDSDEGVYWRLRSATGTWNTMQRLDDGYTPALTAIPGTNDFYVAHPYPRGQWNHIVGRRWSGGAWSARERVSRALADDYSPNCDVAADAQGNIYCCWEYWGSGKPVAYYAVRAEAPSAALVEPLHGQGFPAPGAFTLTAAPGTATTTLAKVEFLQNGVKLGERTAAPWTWPVSGLAAGTWRFEAVGTESGGRSVASAPVDVLVAAGTQAALIPVDAPWRYLDDGSNQGVAWRATSFADTGWKVGAAPLGYGDGDEATVVEDNATPGYNAADTTRHITTWFRHSFTLTGPGAVKALLARLVRDDGAAVYLNGTEVHRSNLPDGAAHDTLATATVSGADESTALPFVVPPALLVAGKNVVAVEVHQAAASSSDLSFALDLTALQAAPSAPRVKLATPPEGTVFGAPASFTARADVVDDDGDATGVDFFLGGTKIAEAVAPPYLVEIASLPAGATELRAVARDAAGFTSEPAVRTVVVTPERPATLAAAASVWRYLDTGVAAPAAWRTVAFDDAGWRAGQGELGFGDGGETTPVAPGPDAARHMTTYFRHRFAVADPAAVHTLRLRLVCDDGAVIHLNGAEVARFNMPAGAIAHATPAVTAIAGDDEALWRLLTLDPTRLVAGENVLAVEVHQSGPTSSDLSFDAALEAFTATSLPQVQPSVAGGALVLSWPGWAVDWTPEASVDLVNWQPLVLVPVPAGDRLTLTLPSPPRTTFFRLVEP